MKSFRTLRGFVEGSEADEPNSFGHSASLRIFGEALDLDEVTRIMGVQPSVAYRKGERRGPRSPPNKHDMWMLSSDLPEERDLGDHIDALWEKIKHRVEYLRGLKRVATVDVFLGYKSNVDHAGVEVPYRSLEMFIQLELPLGLSIVVG